MERAEAALKTSFRKEMALKPATQQALLDDSWVVNAQSVVSCDDFFVDELLDLSNDDADDEEDEPKPAPVSASVLLLQQRLEEDEEQMKIEQPDEKDGNFAENDQFVTIPTGEISVPPEDMANLEWLSHFVEDSFPEYATTPFLTGATPERPMKMIEVQTKQGTTEPPFKTPVPAKARSKRGRTGGRVWSLGSPSLTESSSSSATSSSSCSSPCSPWLIYAHPNPNPAYSVHNHTWKKQRRAGTESVRRCSHCGVQKTPQWRTGPEGAKTLCNACGVRFKSGRLLPEYRPACSPTFSSELHSNHHRKVIEMRRKKETLPRPDSQAVTSF